MIPFELKLFLTCYIIRNTIFKYNICVALARYGLME